MLSSIAAKHSICTVHFNEYVATNRNECSPYAMYVINFLGDIYALPALYVFTIQ